MSDKKWAKGDKRHKRVDDQTGPAGTLNTVTVRKHFKKGR